MSDQTNNNTSYRKITLRRRKKIFCNWEITKSSKPWKIEIVERWWRRRDFQYICIVWNKKQDRYHTSVKKKIKIKNKKMYLPLPKIFFSAKLLSCEYDKIRAFSHWKARYIKKKCHLKISNAFLVVQNLVVSFYKLMKIPALSHAA